MAKKKSKSSSIKKNGRRASINGANNYSTSPANQEQERYNPAMIGAAVAAFFAFNLAVSYAGSLFANPSLEIQNLDHENNNDQPSTIKKDAFLKWFVDNGGTFHPIGFTDDDDNDGMSVNVTIEEFPSFGGWGLALPRIPPKASTTLFQSSSSEELCQSENQSTNEECMAGDEDETSSSPIIRHLDPLFTVPSSIIISVNSVLEAYASSPSGTLHPSDFYPEVNKILTTTFPNDGPGLAKRGMGLVQQDAVIALYLMAEDCIHRNSKDVFENEEGSRWGPYLDVLPQYTIPRLDTFGDEEYGALKDENLEHAGRTSRRLLEQMYIGGNNNGSSLKAVVQDMIRKKIGGAMSSSSSTIPESCISFEAFHRFVAIVSSRAMVLKGEKHLTPLAEMINYSPKVAMHNHEGSKDWIRAPFDLYHTLSDDNSITVRSDRDIFLTTETLNDENAMIQLFEDYGPVDSSLFLEAHGFVPHENPNNCATIPGPNFLRRSAATGRYDANAALVLRAFKELHLIHPQQQKFETLEDVCVKENLELVDDGDTIGRKPASDSISIASLILGDSGNPVWDRMENEYEESFEVLREKCIGAIRSGDGERMEIRCARFPGSGSVVRQALQTASRRTVASFEEKADTEAKLLLELEQAESHGNNQLSLALRFRIQERRILNKIAHSPDKADHSRMSSDDIGTNTSESKETLEEKLEAFNSFIQSLELPLNKIEPKLVGNGMRIGVFATEDLEVDDAYISLPDHSVIDVTTALGDVDASSSFASLLRKYSTPDDSQPNDGFDALLLYILHERFILKERSRFWAYLNLLPSLEEMSEFHPLFFEEEEIDRHLAGSDVRRFILRYQRRAAERHAALSSDLDVNLVLSSDIMLDKSKVYWATAVLDSRSIWWDGKRHLSPLLDLVNADGIGRAHDTRLERSEDGKQQVAVTKASRHVNKGEQLFENYAQPNYVLFTYHGFLLEDNANDCALLDGLFIQRNDPGARSAHHHLQSMAPKFCIKDKASIEELAHFLRVKHGLSLANESAPSNNDDVRPYMIEVLEARIARLRESVDTSIDTDGLTSSRLHFMRQMVKNDLIHFQHAMDTHVLPQIVVMEG